MSDFYQFRCGKKNKMGGVKGKAKKYKMSIPTMRYLGRLEDTLSARTGWVWERFLNTCF